MNQTTIDLLKEIVSRQKKVIQVVNDIPEILGSAEDIMIDTPAMDLLEESIENVVKQIKGIEEDLNQIISHEIKN